MGNHIQTPHHHATSHSLHPHVHLCIPSSLFFSLLPGALFFCATLILQLFPASSSCYCCRRLQGSPRDLNTSVSKPAIFSAGGAIFFLAESLELPLLCSQADTS